MAKVIATAGGVALKPGVSANRRLYTAPMIARAVARAQERVRAGHKPMTQLTFHGAEDNSREIAASLTGWSLDEDGNARWSSAFTDTDAGWDIAKLVDTSDGLPPHLKNVSIRGHWVGTVRKVKGPDGLPVETADDLELDGLDFTKTPGVAGAQVDTFAWAGGSKTETTERVYITESVQEARVTTITEETAAEAEQSCADMGHQCCKDAAESADAQTDAPAGSTYADPGYLKDGKKRYPLNNAKRIRAAWSYINQKDNAAQYTSQQLKRIKGKIKAAMKRIGATVADEGYVLWPAEQVTETDPAVAECMNGGMDGSFSVCATNGPLNVSVSSYCVDPADLDLILRAAADAACAAMKVIDPDMDGDMDVPGADSEDTDGDMESAPSAESADPEPVTETTTDPAPEPAAEPHTETEVPAMADTATPAVEASPAAATETTETAPAAPAMVALTREQFDLLLARSPAPVAATEAAPAAPATETPAAPVAETQEQREARLGAIVDQRLAEAAAAQGITLAETDEQIMDRLLEAKLVPLRQAAAEQGHGVQRQGFTTGRVNENTAPGASGFVATNSHGMPAGAPDKPLHQYTDEELARHGHPLLVGHAFGDRAYKLG